MFHLYVSSLCFIFMFHLYVSIKVSSSEIFQFQFQGKSWKYHTKAENVSEYRAFIEDCGRTINIQISDNLVGVSCKNGKTALICVNYIY